MTTKIIDIFNKYLLYGTFILLIVPFIMIIINDNYTYLIIFENISLPIFLSCYAIFWIIFTRQIENDKMELIVKENHNNNIKGKGFLIEQIKSIDNRIDLLKSNIYKAEVHLNHINETLRVGIVIGTIVKLLNFL